MAARRNLLTDVPGLRVGHAHDLVARTGVTVILPDAPAVCAVDVRGGGPGTRETDALAPDTLVETVDALVLSGGSVYGLAAADGVAAWLGGRGRGFDFRPSPGVPPSPIVPAAVLYDLANGGAKDWGLEPPYRRLGLAAADAALAGDGGFALGSVGAGLGAAAGALCGGIGSASDAVDGHPTVAALAAVNSFGAVVGPDLRFLAAPYERDGEFGGLGPPRCDAGAESGPGSWPWSKADPAPRAQTTLAVVATDAALTPAEARRVAVMAQAGLTRAIRPAHTPFDGDVVFVLSTGAAPLSEPLLESRPVSLLRLGARAADTLARAIARGAYEATSQWPGAAPSWRDAWADHAPPPDLHPPN